MKCAACDYEYEEKSNGLKWPRHGFITIKGDDPFYEIENNVRSVAVDGCSRKMTLYVCPKCGTVKAVQIL